MKISKKTREQAALICAIAASNFDFAESYSAIAIGLWPNSRGRSDAYDLAHDLAFRAWDEASRLGLPWPCVDAEAESLLRTGWSP